MNKCRKIGGRYVASACNGALNNERFGEQAETIVAPTQHQLLTHTIIITLYTEVILIIVDLNIRNLYPLYIHVHIRNNSFKRISNGENPVQSDAENPPEFEH